MRIEQALCICSNTDGPWVEVRRVKEIHLRDATKDDLIEIEFREHDLTTAPSQLLMRGTVVKKLDFPKGQIRVRRVSGRSFITVVAYSERFANASPSEKQLLRDDRGGRYEVTPAFRVAGVD